MSAGMGSVYQRGKVWWVYYGFQGERHRESSGSTKKSDANKLLKRRLAEMGRGQLIGPDQERLRYEDLEQTIEDEYRANERRSVKRLKTSLKHLRGFFGKMRALDITTDKIRRYIGTRQDEGAANASIQAELAALKRAFNLAAQAQQISNVPFIPSVKVSNTREGFFEAGELSALLKELPEQLKQVVRFAALTGWRKEEVLSLQWRQVDWDAGMVRLEPGTTKNSEGREFPFRSLPELEALIEEQRSQTDVVERRVEQIVPFVFHRNGRQILSIRGAWDAACDRAGLSGYWFHDLRRTAVRNLEAAGVPRSVAMKLTGHKTESVYRRYAIVDKKSLEEGVEKLAQLHLVRSKDRKVLPMQERAQA